MKTRRKQKYLFYDIQNIYLFLITYVICIIRMCQKPIDPF